MARPYRRHRRSTVTPSVRVQDEWRMTEAPERSRGWLVARRPSLGRNDHRGRTGQAIEVLHEASGLRCVVRLEIVRPAIGDGLVTQLHDNPSKPATCGHLDPVAETVDPTGKR